MTGSRRPARHSASTTPDSAGLYQFDVRHAPLIISRPIATVEVMVQSAGILCDPGALFLFHEFRINHCDRRIPRRHSVQVRSLAFSVRTSYPHRRRSVPVHEQPPQPASPQPARSETSSAPDTKGHDDLCHPRSGPGVGVRAVLVVRGCRAGRRPVLAGVLLDHFWWDSIFLVNVLLGLLGVAGGHVNRRRWL
ncbi:hypothetical protein Francci3_2806 [Frankia casuarinae]|uniref:Uncharacterized protein n=1 Tax=Frankia casuarinae (strain DSM 45818 / CECT 9043 / HFP020203 / CcI3) TaxID=106370 RepID=Q2J978_FRACC|nr:hypothetical protein Francci3_2806 [Frankia casuarinae]